jgi:uncharacterized damage-inducible protein DinB
MNADAFRHLYGYHFAQNRETWNAVLELSDEDFVAGTAYSHGSVRDQVLHIATVDDAWFGGLLGETEPSDPEPDQVADRAGIRAYWDEVERRMREYLDDLTDDALPGYPWEDGEDKDLALWQVLIHVVNHGTDHRAQLLRQLHDLGVKTSSQDYVFYAYDHPTR